MAAYPIVVIDPDGQVEIPEEFRQDPRYQGGARLQLVPVRVEATEEGRTLAWDNFLKLRGMFADSDYDPNAELENEKRRELEDEARWTRD